MSPLTTRSYKDSDLEGVVSLWAEVFPNEPSWNESQALIARKLTTQPELFFVCLAEDRIVGTTIAGFDGVRGWVHKVATSPTHRRYGIARVLMQTAEKALADLGCTKINLQVRAGNNSAVEFYRDAGYVTEDRVSMAKHIATLTPDTPDPQ